MAGTYEGGIAAAQTNKELYGEDFYVRLGHLSQIAWRKNGRKPRGFAANQELASRAGKKGGNAFKHIKGETTERRKARKLIWRKNNAA